MEGVVQINANLMKLFSLMADVCHVGIIQESYKMVEHVVTLAAHVKRSL